MVIQIMPSVPRAFLRDFIPDKFYKTFHAWQNGKRAPKKVDGLIEATVAWAKQNVPDTKDLASKDLLKAYLAYKNKLYKKVRGSAKKIPDSVLHHQLNLNARTIMKLRAGHALRIETLQRLQSIL